MVFIMVVCDDVLNEKFGVCVGYWWIYFWYFGGYWWISFVV